LQPEVLNRCQEGEEEARALLGLVLCSIAPRDSSWRETATVTGRKSGLDVPLSVSPALWLADLRFRAWVPVPGEEGKVSKMLANPATLMSLLDPSWLVGNDAAVQLLSKWFGFDELELRLLGVAPDEQARGELRNSLARLVEWGGPDPALYASLQQEVEARRKRSRDVDRCRRFGLAVQDAVREAMESRGLLLELIDRGFDYEATAGDDVIADSASSIGVGSYYIEVKATTNGAARMTPLQAVTASLNAARYALCVVDLRGLSEDDLDEEWTASRVEPLARVVPSIGGRLEETCRLVDAAKTTAVGIRNDAALRYEVPTTLWEGGLSIADWIGSIVDSTK
jgi:hypothetical protein